jgi:hypothetical protein
VSDGSRARGEGWHLQAPEHRVQRDGGLLWSREALLRPAACPGQKPSLWAVKRPVRPYKSAIQNRFTVGNAEGA